MSPAPRLPDFDAVVLAGGGARRLGGVHKPTLLVGGQQVIRRVAAAVSDASHLIVVGPRDGVPDQAVVTREDPPGAGPVPALAAGLRLVCSPWVAVLAGDLPFLRTSDVTALREQACGGDGAVLVDAEGNDQWLIGVWRVRALVTAMAGNEGSSLRGLLDPLRPFRLRLPVPADVPPPWLDCDTMGDLETARTWT